MCPATGEAPPAETPGELLLRHFTELRDDLVSTLWFVLGNQEDAQDVAQEVFLPAGARRTGWPMCKTCAPWIFRVGLNAAKDVQRSAWRRRVKHLLGAETMPSATNGSPTAVLEDQETLAQLRQALLHLRRKKKKSFYYGKTAS